MTSSIALFVLALRKNYALPSAWQSQGLSFHRVLSLIRLDPQVDLMVDHLRVHIVWVYRKEHEILRIFTIVETLKDVLHNEDMV